jgi:hypothetical protein
VKSTETNRADTLNVTREKLPCLIKTEKHNMRRVWPKFREHKFWHDTIRRE